MSVWGERKCTSYMYVPACRLISFHVAVMPSFVFFFSVLKMSITSYNIHLWQFWKFPRRRVCLKKSIFGKENSKRSVTCGPNLSPWWLMSLQGLLKGFPGLWWRHSRLPLWPQTWSPVLVWQTCNMYKQPWVFDWLWNIPGHSFSNSGR